MGRKDKKGSKRLSKKDIRERVLALVEAEPEREFDVKTFFAATGATTHPSKMLVVDTLGELVLDD